MTQQKWWETIACDVPHNNHMLACRAAIHKRYEEEQPLELNLKNRKGPRPVNEEQEFQQGKMRGSPR